MLNFLWEIFNILYMCVKTYTYTSSYRTNVWVIFTRLFGRLGLIIGHARYCQCSGKLLFKYKDGGSTGVMGFQFFTCKRKKGWKGKLKKGNNRPTYRRKIFGNILPQAVLVKDTLFKRQWKKNESVTKNWILLYFVRVENEFSAEHSLPETFCNTRDIPGISGNYSVPIESDDQVRVRRENNFVPE